MHATRQDVLEHRLAASLPDLRLPAPLLRRLAEVLGDEVPVLICGDLRPLGFGAYGGQLCLVTGSRVVLATGTRRPDADGAFGLEEWQRALAPLPRFTPVAPRSPEADPRPVLRRQV